MNDEDAKLEARRRREKDELARNQVEEDLLAVMRTGPGRRFIWHMVYHRCALQGVSLEPTEFLRAVDTGRRLVGKELEQLAQRVAPHEWWQAVDELREKLMEHAAANKKKRENDAFPLDDDDDG